MNLLASLGVIELRVNQFILFMLTEHFSGNVLTIFECPWSMVHLTPVNTVFPLQRSTVKKSETDINTSNKLHETLPRKMLQVYKSKVHIKSLYIL